MQEKPVTRTGGSVSASAMLRAGWTKACVYCSPQKQLCAECGPHVVSRVKLRRTGWFVVPLEKAGSKRNRELTHVGEKNDFQTM